MLEGVVKSWVRPTQGPFQAVQVLPEDSGVTAASAEQVSLCLKALPILSRLSVAHVQGREAEE